MSRLVLVRHGEAAAGWGDDLDPGLSPAGRQQAADMAAAVGPLGPLRVVVSPLRRTRETAAPLCAAWNVEPVIEPSVAEVPSPSDDLAERSAFLGELFRTPWEAWPRDLDRWRKAVRRTLIGIPTDAIVVTHFIAITVAIDDPSFRPGYCSLTVVDTGGGVIRVVELGEQHTTIVR